MTCNPSTPSVQHEQKRKRWTLHLLFYEPQYKNRDIFNISLYLTTSFLVLHPWQSAKKKGDLDWGFSVFGRCCLLPGTCPVYSFCSPVMWKTFLISSPNQFNLKLTSQIQQSICEYVGFELQHCSVGWSEPACSPRTAFLWTNLLLSHESAGAAFCARRSQWLWLKVVAVAPVVGRSGRWNCCVPHPI